MLVCIEAYMYSWEKEATALHLTFCCVIKSTLCCLSSAFNYSHRIDVLSFGPWAPGYVNPLDGDVITTDKRKYINNKCEFTAVN